MKALIQYSDTAIRLENSMTASVQQFRKCKDSIGLDKFLNVIEELEILIDISKYYINPNYKVRKINELLENIVNLMENQDITGLTDVIEYELYPLAKSFTEEVLELNDNC